MSQMGTTPIEILNCKIRMFNIGTYSVDKEYCKHVELTANHIKLILKRGPHSVERRCIKIKPGDVQLIERCLIQCWKLHCLFIQTLPEKTNEIKRICEMKDPKGFWYDPSSDDECHRRIQVILETTYDEQLQVHTLLMAFSKNYNVSKELMMESISDKDTVNGLLTMISSKSREAANYEKSKAVEAARNSDSKTSRNSDSKTSRNSDSKTSRNSDSKTKKRQVDAPTMTTTIKKSRTEQSTTPVSKHLRSSTVTQSSASCAIVANKHKDPNKDTQKTQNTNPHKAFKTDQQKGINSSSTTQLKTENDKLKEENKKLQKELRKIKQENQLLMQQKDQAEARVKKLEKGGNAKKMVSESKQRLQAAESNASEYQAKNKTLLKELAELQEKVTTAEQRIKEIEQEKSEQDNKYATMMSNVDYARMKIEKELKAVKEQCTKLEENLESCVNDKMAISTDKMTISNTLMSLRGYVLKVLKMLIPPLAEHDIKLNHEVDEMLEEFVEHQP